MDIEVLDKPGARIIRIRGGLYKEEADLVEIFARCRRDPVDCVVNLKNVTYVSSGFLALLSELDMALAEHDCALKVVSPMGSTRGVFEVVGFDRLVDVHATEQEALQSLGG